MLWSINGWSMYGNIFMGKFNIYLDYDNVNGGYECDETLPLNTPVQLTMIWESNAGTIRVYKDFNELSCRFHGTPFPSSFNSWTHEEIYIGYSPSSPLQDVVVGGKHSFCGTIHSISFYNGILIPALE